MVSWSRNFNHPFLQSIVAKRIIQTVLYYDIFNHPLREDEISYFAADSRSLDEVAKTVEQLISSKMLFEIDGYYSISPNFKEHINARQEGERIAKQEQHKAFSRAKFIGKFPYVRAAYISGSMSKGVMHQDGDVDYFVVTEPGRLWIARTFLVLFKKTVLFNSHKYFCLNYFIDSDNLEIEEKNLFTATETVTLKPIYDDGVYVDFRKANNWVSEYIPDSQKQEIIYNGETKRPFAKMVESVLNNKLGDKLDEWFMYTTLNVWKRKFKHLGSVDFDLALKTRKYVSKHHPRNFQARVLQAFDERITSFEQKHNIKLN